MVDVVDGFDVGSDKTRFGVIKFRYVQAVGFKQRLVQIYRTQTYVGIRNIDFFASEN